MFYLLFVDGMMFFGELGVFFVVGCQCKVLFVVGGMSFDGVILVMVCIFYESVFVGFGDDFDVFCEFYVGDFVVSDFQGVSCFFGDLCYIVVLWILVCLMEGVGKLVYFYFFYYVLLVKCGEWIGMLYGGEVVLFFGVVCEFFDDEMSVVGVKMCSVFVYFVKIGVFGGESLFEWLVYIVENDVWMVFGQVFVVCCGVFEVCFDLIECCYCE